jgi:hypothetical protein
LHRPQLIFAIRVFSDDIRQLIGSYAASSLAIPGNRGNSRERSGTIVSVELELGAQADPARAATDPQRDHAGGAIGKLLGIFHAPFERGLAADPNFALLSKVWDGGRGWD